MNLKKYLPIIGISIFIYILLKLDIYNVLKEISKANINLLLIAIFLVFLTFITQTLKWFSIARVQTSKIGFLEAFKINLISLFYGFITPSRVGAVIRAEYLKKYNDGKIGKGISNYVLDKMIDLCSLVLLAAIFSFVFREILSNNYLYYAILVFMLLVSLLIVFRSKERSKAILGIFYRKFVPEKIKLKLKGEFYSFYENMPKKRYFILFFLLNFLNWIVLYMSVFFVGLSLGIDVSFFYFLAIMPIATFVGQLPITISGLGTREAVLISLFGLAGVGATKIFSMSIISLLISGILPSIIGIFLILRDKKRI
ncbi:hypothetical protein BMS3Abin17_01168 [archaeon BMS3Abin17]|nr:hypothetical protein BMS3Abin17_01168 [archaeon BMS3Abin17]HDZ60387.1 flippase-like domain-containing protein [Candidatus Pacearchaeota archaeon]